MKDEGHRQRPDPQAKDPFCELVDYRYGTCAVVFDVASLLVLANLSTGVKCN